VFIVSISLKFVWPRSTRVKVEVENRLHIIVRYARYSSFSKDYISQIRILSVLYLDASKNLHAT